MTFANAVATQRVQTTNGMEAHAGTGSSVLNYFSSVGARRGKDNIPLFKQAFNESEDLAIRALLWTRDVRGGAGERQTFKDILKHLCMTNFTLAKRVMYRVAEVGRFDDLLVAIGTVAEAHAFELIARALKDGNGLCAKWMPRKGAEANALRKYLQMTPKQYRKTLVSLTNVVETPMCANDWESIEVEKVPSLAGIRYRKAFTKHIPHKIDTFAKKVAAGEVKVNAGAVYPHQIVQQIQRTGDTNERIILQGQWDNLKNYVPEGSKVLPMVDVSGSMGCPAGGSTSVTCMDVAIALGLYLAEKNTGDFKDLFLTFSSSPELVKLEDETLYDRIYQMSRARWGMSTNVMAAFELILRTAINGKVAQEDMPQTVVIFSDMQFDRCASYSGTSYEQAKAMFAAAGYTAPRVVFWNLNDHGNKATTKDEIGAALVSGFSPSLMENVLGNNLEVYSPYNVMLDVLKQERYNY